MTTLMRSPEGAQAQVSSTEAEDLKKLGWKERSYEEYKKSATVPVAKTGGSDTLQVVVPVAAAPQDTLKRRPGRPPKHPVAEHGHGNRPNDN